MSGTNNTGYGVVSRQLMTDIADAIRDREGSEETIQPVDFPSHIANMTVGQQGAPVSSVAITNKSALSSIRPNHTAEIEVSIEPEWDGWEYSCTSSDPAVVSVSATRNQDGKYVITGVAEADDPVTITVTAGDFSDTVSVKCQDLFTPDLTQPLNAEQRANLQNIVAAGAASNFLSTGQTILVSYGTYTMPFVITGFRDVQHWNGSEYETKHAINLLAQYTSEVDSQWGANGSTKYSASTLRASITTTYQNKLDPNFVACLANTKVQTFSRDNTTDVVNDKLFAPSMAELGVTDTTYNNANQAAAEGSAFTSFQGAGNAQRIKNAINATTTAQYYWTRSLSSGNSSFFGRVRTSGAPSSGSCGDTIRVVAACNFIG